MRLTFEQSIAKGKITKVLQRNDIQLEDYKEDRLNYLIEKIYYDENSLSIIVEMLELIADSNYRLGAERQKETVIRYEQVLKQIESWTKNPREYEPSLYSINNMCKDVLGMSVK